jgi:hypothetical protein
MQKEKAMELIDRYVAEVGRHLPPRQRADIEAELRSLLMDSLEARSQGEPAQKDVISLLLEFGHPQKVAYSYWPEGQYLIGPSLYPLFRMVAGIALLVVVIVQLVLLGVAVVFQPEALPVRGFLDDFVPTIVSVFGWVVLGFALMQRLNIRPKIGEEDWDPFNLPPIENPEPFSQVGTVIEIAMGLVLIVLLAMLPEQLPQVLPAGVQVYISPVLIQYLPLLVLSIALGVGLNVILLWRGKWETGTRLAKIVLNLFGIGVLALLISGHTAWLVEHNAAGFLTAIQRLPESGQFSPTDTQILSMQLYRMVFIVALLATLVDTIQVGWRLIKSMFEHSSVPTYPSGTPSAG